jgi:hypothetical protein
MTWAVYRLAYQALSPVHLGYHTLGYIKLTRPYITGRAMWGAATAGLTRCYGMPDEADRSYRWFGNHVKKNVIFSYFFPAIDTSAPLLPAFSSNGLKFGSYSQYDFQRIFIGSTTQTAVDPDSNTAEDESLHESEYIRHKVMDIDGTVKDIHFVGYLFINEHIGLDIQHVPGVMGWRGCDMAVETAVREISIGGDNKYGWGRLRLCPDLCGPADEFFMNELVIADDGENRPEIVFPSNQMLPAHLCIDEDVCAKGDIEPLAFRQWRAHHDAKDGHEGAGQMLLSSSSLYWMPGTILNTAVRFEVGEYGILEKVKGNAKKDNGEAK